MSAPKGYSCVFNIEAVEQGTQHDRVRRQVARDPGIDPSNLRNWIEHFSAEYVEGASGSSALQDEEVRRLLREHAATRNERDILKKAVGIFSQMPRQ
jgi:transposase